MRWADLHEPLRGPVVLVVDQPGGPIDQLVADADVTTFLNDRFTPVFLTPAAAPELPAATVQVLDARGCWLAGAQAPADPAGLIALLNSAVERVSAGVPSEPRPAPPSTWGVPVPPEHPLARPCAAP